MLFTQGIPDKNPKQEREESIMVGRCVCHRVRENSFFLWSSEILDLKNSFCDFKKNMPPLFFTYQEKWTHDTRENPFSESLLFALLGGEAGVASTATSTSWGSAFFCHWDGLRVPLAYFPPPATRIFSLSLFSILFVRVSQSLLRNF